MDQTLVIDDDFAREGLSELEKQNSARLAMRAMVATTLRKGKNKPLWSLVAINATPRHWRAGEIKLIEDVAERTWTAIDRASAEETLHVSRIRFESTVNLVPDLLWDSNPDGATNWYNDRWLSYTGQTRQEAIGWGWTEAIHPDDRAASVSRYREAIAAGQPLRLEERIRRYDGVYRWFVVNAAPLKDERGRVVKMYGAATDIHESKRLEATLRQADQRKDEFLAMLAHELRNPMATIRSGLSILDLTVVDERTRPTVTRMRRQADHLVRMVDDLLDVSRIRQGKIELKTTPVDLGGVVREATDSVRPLFEEQGKQLQMTLSATPIYVQGDPTRLVQVVTNLLTNAVRYTGERGQIWVRLAHRQQEAWLEVDDNGIGLSPDQLTAIFSLFVQVDNSVARSRGGLGLGLTLVKRLVELHGGRVEAQSEGLGKGSTFLVRLPSLETAPKTTQAPVAPPVAQVAPTRILIIDDNADAGLLLAMLLNLKGYEAHVRHSGQAGLEAVEALAPAVILLDIGMPDLDGYATHRLLREQPWGASVPVIALTGYGQDQDRQRTRAAGFDGHLVKPVELDALLSTLAQVLKQTDTAPNRP